MTLELREGAVIAGKLRLERLLGQGGMGVVWAARHESLGTDVAVKLIRPERVAADPALIRRFELEAKTTARLAHPNVVHVMDYGTADGVPYIVMELLQGFSLAELLASGGRLSLSTAVVLVRQIGSALAVAHERGVVHRDIKPHNVFILEQSQGYPLFVKVLDFGIAKILGDSELPGVDHTLTQTGSIIGSPPYMSPEQIEGQKHVDLRSDLWSLGVIVYESLTGEAPFRGSSFVAVGAAVLAGKYRPATELRRGLPRAMDDWFAKALCLDPAGRFQSASEMVAAFEAVHASIAEEPPIASGRAFVASAFAETLDAAPPAEQSEMHDAAPVAERTETHAPVAPKRARLTRRRIASAAALGVVALGVAAAASAFGRRTGHGSCPAGMKRIDAATFDVGSAAAGETPGDETPAHSVTLAAFCLDETEVTARAYSSCKSCPRLPGSVEAEGLTKNAVSFWSQFCNLADAGDKPVNCVDFQHATKFCEAQGKRLPSEAEWELAARGPHTSTYPWGEAPPSGARLNACGAECSRMLSERLEKSGRGPWPKMYADDDSAPSTAPVGSHPAGATPAGILDLAGNVWEWTSSHYCRYDEPDCGDSRRVIRGGGWDTVESQDVRAARRLPSAPSARSWSVGFRCAKAL